MRNWITFGTIDSRDYGIYISGTGRLNIPERVYEMVSVPGKMGDVAIDYKKVANAALTYPAFFAPVFSQYENLNDAVGAFRNAMLSVHGYAPLRDTYDPTRYRKAVFLGDIDIKPTDVLDAANFDLTFNVAPQRYVDLPEITISGTVQPNVTLAQELSLTEFPANIMNLEPIITIGGTGNTAVYFCKHGQGLPAGLIHRIIVRRTDEEVIVNSHLKECYTSGGTSANQMVEFSNYQFPVFGPFFGYAGAVDVLIMGATGEKTITIAPGGYEL